MDFQQFVSDSAAAPVLAALAAAKWRKARDLAKDLCKKNRTRYLPLLIEANVGLARELQAKGLATDAEPVLAYLKSICPADLWEKLALELAPAPSPDAQNSAGAVPGTSLTGSPALMLASVWSVVMEAADLAQQGLPVSPTQWAAVDVAVGAFAAAPRGEPGSREARLAEELEVIHQACAATGEGRWEDAQASLRALARQSVFQHWRMFLRGVRHHFLRETGLSRRCFANLPKDGALARAAAVIAGSGAVPGATQKAPTRARADWWLAVSGQPRTLAAALAEAHLAWMKPDVRKCFELLRKAFGKKFPGHQPDLAGLLSSVVLPSRVRGSELREKRERQWDQLRQILLRRSDEPQLLCSLLRIFSLHNSQAVSTKHLFSEWSAMLALETQIHGPNSLRDSIGWMWLGEEMMRPPEPGLFPCNESTHRHGDRAREALQKAVDFDPGNEAAYLALLRLHTERGDVPARNKLLDVLVKQFPENKEVLVQTGLLAAERRAFSKALQSLRAARALDPLDRKARAALVTALFLQARDLFRKERPTAAVWEEIDTLTQETAGPGYHTLARWTHRVRRAMLERSDALAAEAAALARYPVQALFFERLLSQIYRCQTRVAWEKDWNAAIAEGAGWRALTALLEGAREICLLKGFGFSDSRLAERLLGEALAPTLRLHLRSDFEGLLQFIEQSSAAAKSDLERRWISPCLTEVHWRLERSFSRYAKKPGNDPHLCLCALYIESRHFFFEPDSRFYRCLEGVLVAAKKKGMTAVVEAALRLKDELDEPRRQPETLKAPLGDEEGEGEDAFERTGPKRGSDQPKPSPLDRHPELDLF